MMWLFSIKTDGTKKARLVGRGDLMIPWVDFDPTPYTAVMSMRLRSKLLSSSPPHTNCPCGEEI
jgi:hypothetical protein